MRDFWVLAVDAFDNQFDTIVPAVNVFGLYAFFDEMYPGCRIIDYEEEK